MKTISPSCIVLLLLAAVVTAKEEVPTNVVAGKKVSPDANLRIGDKFVTFDEKKPYLVEVIRVNRDKSVVIHWIGFDKEQDSDATLDVLYIPAETLATRKTRTSPLPAEYQALDKDGDGQIGLYEWARSKYADFKKLDKNGDGFLTPKELAGKTGGGVVAAADASPVKEMPAVPEPKPDPGNLETFNDKIKESFTFTVTGRTDGAVWGTGPYATMSDLASAAVHAGVLKDGTKGTVTVTIVESPETFGGSDANGVFSNESPKAAAAFTVK